MKAAVKKEVFKDKLSLRLNLYTHCVSLTLDKSLCLKCEICTLVCPKEAVRVISDDGLLDIDLDEGSCLLCELCSSFCPVAALSLSFNLGPKTVLKDQKASATPPLGPLVDPSRCSYGCDPVAGALPHWCRKVKGWVENDPDTCPKQCLKCLENCAREAFRVEGGEVMTDPSPCLHCLTCLTGCPQEALFVEPYFLGEIEFDPKLCPEDCRLCVEVCPLKCFEFKEGKVELVKKTCLLCGACANVCGFGALKIRRDWVFGEGLALSTLWDEAVKRLKREA